MGRHSAGDDDDVDDAILATSVLNLGTGSGRHASAEGAEDPGPDDQLTQVIAAVHPDADVDDRHDTDVLPEVPALEPEVGQLPEPPAESTPSRADKRAARKAAKAAERVRQEAERQALRQADEAAAQATAALPTEPPAPPGSDPAVEAQPVKEQKADRAESDTRADLRLLRQNGAVRARCVAALLVSFLLYTLVLLLIGRTDVYLLWIWIPIVLSGVLVGALLDLAHRAAARDAQPATVPETSTNEQT